MEPITKGSWALFVLCTFLLCCNGTEVNSDSLRQLEYDVVDLDKGIDGDAAQLKDSSSDAAKVAAVLPSDGSNTGMDVPQLPEFMYSVWQNQEKEPSIAMAEESTMDGVSVEVSVDGVERGTLIPEEVKEPIVKKKKATCVGCPTMVDLSILENRLAIEKLLESPLDAIDAKSQNQYKYSSPKILSVTKQVESGVKFTVTFETYLSWCFNNAVDKRTRKECPPQSLEQKQVCVVELVDKMKGAPYASYNNCTENTENEMPDKSWEIEDNTSHSRGPDRDPELITIVESNNMDSSFIKNDRVDESEEDQSQSSEVRENFPVNEDNAEVEEIRMRRSVNVGALRDVDKSEFGLIAQFAELAVKTLDEIDPDNTKQMVLGITEAKKQIVNGVMYHLVLQVGTSTCEESEDNNSDSKNCVENNLYPERVCRVQIHRSWADESPLNAKVVKSECADVWPSDVPYEPLPVERARRSSQENWPSTDGWKKYELEDRSQSDCLTKVMTSFQDVLNVSDVTKVATIRDAHTRVNKESLQPEMVVTILLTDAEKLRMMGDVKKPMVVSSRVICTQRLKRSSGVPGGLTDADVNDPRVIEMTNFAMSAIQNSVNSPYRHKLVRIIEARKQVVAGTLYHFKLEISPTSCLKSDTDSTQSCTSSGNEQLLICTLKVWDQPWTKLREVKDLDCGSSRKKREEHLLGGPQHIDAEDPYVKELASFALAEIDKGLNSPYQQKVVRVVEAKTQVVAGTLMHLKLELATTNCLKSEKVASENCVFGSDQPTTMCSVKVWDRLWLKKREMQDLQCGRTRSKRQAFAEVDVNDPYIIESANFALAELDKATNSPYRHKLVHVVSAHIEHSSSTRLKLDLEVGYSNCKKSSTSNDCSLLEGSGRKKCSVELLHFPLSQDRYLTSKRCSPQDFEPQESQPQNHHLAAENDVHVADHFRSFIRNFNKTYSSDAELHKRFRIFRANLKIIERLQSTEQGTAVYGPTIFADLSPKEFKSKYLGLRKDLRQENAIPMRMADIPNIRLPTSFDWRDHNAVTPVKNQGACGSCWAFAVTGNIEGQYAINHGKLLSLSEQELVDCDTLDDGCKGGLPENAYHALEQLGGIETEKDYPYDGEDEQCHFNRSEARVQVKSSVNITTNESDMAKWLVKNGPIAIGINANAMQFYVGGVSHPFKFLCSPGDLDHGVLIVGFGVHTTSIRHKVLPYWLIKNSWGTFWGEKGYYRVYRGDGTCGVNQMASSAVVG